MLDTNMKWYFYVIIGEIIAVVVAIALYVAILVNPNMQAISNLP